MKTVSTKRTETPRIYVADLAAYTAGYLHGKWIDATLDIEEVNAEIAKMLAASPVSDPEEYAIHDYDGFYEGALGEYPNLEEVLRIGRFIDEHGRIAAKLVSHFGGDIDEAERALEEGYRGVYRSVADFAQELTEETSKIPEHLENYIDYDAMGRDLEMGGDIFTIETSYDEVHIFWSNY